MNQSGAAIVKCSHTDTSQRRHYHERSAGKLSQQIRFPPARSLTTPPVHSTSVLREDPIPDAVRVRWNNILEVDIVSH